MTAVFTHYKQEKENWDMTLFTIHRRVGCSQTPFLFIILRQKLSQ